MNLSAYDDNRFGNKWLADTKPNDLQHAQKASGA